LRLFTSRGQRPSGEGDEQADVLASPLNSASSHPKSWQTTRMTGSRWTAAYAGSLYFVTKTK
jgi:hypothetical protein